MLVVRFNSKLVFDKKTLDRIVKDGGKHYIFTINWNSTICR
jgi:hypothetical protein